MKPIKTARGTALEPCRYMEAWRKKRHNENLRLNSAIPAPYRNLTFGDIAARSGNEPAFIAATDLTSLFISGASGTGKTLLLSLIGNEHLARDHSVNYVTTAEMLLQLRYTNDACEDRLKHYQEVDVLLLDDLGLERHSDYNEEQLYMVLEGRARTCKVTVIASHLHLKSLHERYNEQLSRKIARYIEREAHLPELPTVD